DDKWAVGGVDIKVVEMGNSFLNIKREVGFDREGGGVGDEIGGGFVWVFGMGKDEKGKKGV
ncbi:hypothetical protein, partial [Neisseria sicca]|uniref:hypothetical protein n=1 Tax=Neisseria sicca TaxID=490 RepID=UPI001649AAE6